MSRLEKRSCCMKIIETICLTYTAGEGGGGAPSPPPRMPPESERVIITGFGGRSGVGGNASPFVSGEALLSILRVVIARGRWGLGESIPKTRKPCLFLREIIRFPDCHFGVFQQRDRGQGTASEVRCVGGRSLLPLI